MEIAATPAPPASTTPTGCGEYDELAPKNPEREETGKELRVVFEVTQSQPNFAKLFLTSGGSINAAAGLGETDMALTAGASCAHATLSPDEPTRFEMKIPPSMIHAHDGDSAIINSDIKLNVNSNRLGSAINGVIVETHAGAASVYLSQLLAHKDSHCQIPCTYGALMSHACTLGLSNIRVLDGLDQEMNVEFRKDDEAHDITKKGEELVDEWANSAWNTRQVLRYKLSPTLTKSVAKVPVGVNASGYSLVHDVIDQEFPFSVRTLNSLFESAIGMELEFKAENLSKLRDSTREPGLRSSVWAQTVAAATSTAANFLLAYRADGRTIMDTKGSGFTAAESWLRTPMRSPCESNDCDGSALLAASMIQRCVDADAEELKEYPFLRVVKNVVFPYYQVGVTVVGATAAQANDADASGETVAGHALVLMVPTLALLDGLHRSASEHTVAGKPLTDDPTGLQRLRREAVFTDAVLETLPEDEQIKLRSGMIADWEVAKRLQPYAIEGTTPASPILHIPDSSKRSAVADDARRDERAFNVAAPTVARAFKVLHVGGHKGGHKFYHDFVELSFHASNPLYTDAKLREAGHAASQFVFTRPHTTDLKEAGASPKQLVGNDYAVVPLHTINTARGRVLDFAGTASRADVMPTRAESMRLTETQTANLKRSVDALTILNANLPDENDGGHCVAYTLSYSTLVNNPQSVEHFVARVSETSVAGVVDFSMIEDLAIDTDGEQAGNFVVVNAVVAM